jgi:hypothetical protein
MKFEQLLEVVGDEPVTELVRAAPSPAHGRNVARE